MNQELRDKLFRELQKKRIRKPDLIHNFPIYKIGQSCNLKKENHDYIKMNDTYSRCLKCGIMTAPKHTLLSKLDNIEFWVK